MKRILALVLLILFQIFFVSIAPDRQDYLRSENFLILNIAHVFFAVLIIYSLLKKQMSLWEPITLVSTLYFLIFIFRPIIDIANYDTAKFGIDTSEGCIYATTIFLTSFFIMYLAYYSSFSKYKFIQFKDAFYEKIINENICLKMAFTIWIISFSLCIVYFMTSGYSIAYVLTVGASGSFVDNDLNAPVGFLSKVSLCMISTFLYIAIISKSTIKKLIIFIATFNIFLIMGGRSILFSFLFSIVTYYYLKNKKTPSVATILTGILLVTLFFAIVQFARWGLRSGGDIVIPALSLELLMSPFDSELTTYKTFYGMVMNIPDTFNYMYGYEMFYYTLVMVIPRFIWAGKPDAPLRDMLSSVMNEQAVLHGEAWPNLGEFFMEFGFLGCIFFMFLYGKYMRLLNKIRINASANSHAMVLYSVLFPLLLQFTIRGYMPSNFYTFLFAIIPVITIYKTSLRVRNIK